MQITFATHDNFVAFQNMAENMWLNYRDDNQEPEFSLTDRLIDELNAQWLGKDLAYPITLALSDGTAEMAQAVLENALEYDPEDSDEPSIKEGEVGLV